MDKKDNIILVGGGGHCKSCIDVIEQEGRYAIAGVVGIQDEVGKSVLGYRVIGCDNDIEDMTAQYENVLITLGQSRTINRRVVLYDLAKRCGAVFPAIISTRSYVSRHAVIGEGTVIMHHSVVNAGAVVGKGCVINTAAVIEHDAQIGDFTMISPLAAVSGNVKIGRKNLIGAGASIIHNVTICDDVIIGAGAVVVQDISIPGIYVGMPAKQIHGEA